MTETILTYRNDPAFKAAFLAELDKHAALDAFTKGTYGMMNGHFRGCGIGCSLASLNVLRGAPVLEQTGQHERYPSELGWPLWLAYLEDNLFESLPDGLSKTWPARLSAAVPVGVEIPDRVLAKILRWSLANATYGVRHVTDNPEAIAVIDRMIALFDRSIADDEPSDTEWSEVAWDARVAWVAWDAWAARAAWAARDAWAARVAWAARDARAAWEARDGFYPALSDYVISELEALG